jgi:hypothetical protein
VPHKLQPGPGDPVSQRAAERHNLKELRPGSSGASEVRILFIFDPARNAVLVAGDKASRWQEWVPRGDPRRRSGL